MHESLPQLEVVAQFAYPVPDAQSLAYDGKQLWIGSWETKEVVAVDRMGRRRSHIAAPQKPVGCTFVNGRLFFVLSDDNDDRTIRSADEHGNWADDAFACPDEAGSLLSWDGEALWLSQRHLKRVLRLDPTTHAVTTVIDVPEQILGHAWIGDWLYCSLWLGKERGGGVLARISRSDPSTVQPVAAGPFGMIGLVYDGDALWTNESKGERIIAVRIPE